MTEGRYSENERVQGWAICSLGLKEIKHLVAESGDEQGFCTRTGAFGVGEQAKQAIDAGSAVRFTGRENSGNFQTQYHRASDGLKCAFDDAMASMMRAGIIRPLMGLSNSGTAPSSRFQFTDYGWRVVEDLGRGDFPPEDPEGFIRSLAHKAPDLPQTSRTYVEDAVRCFAADLYRPAAAMLGAASEMTLKILAEACANENPSAKKLKSGLEADAFSRWSRSLEQAAESWATRDNHYLDAVRLGIRYYKDPRDNVMHSRPDSVDVWSTRQLLALFPNYASTILNAAAVKPWTKPTQS